MLIQYQQPAITTDHNGDERLVGFELEFTGLNLQQASDCVARALDGKATEQNEAQQQISVADLGEFNVELDWDYLKKAADQSQGASHLALLRDAASLIVPIEVVCPPIAISQLPRLDPLVSALRDAGARGTDDSPIAAYGVHINTSLPDLQADTIDRYLKAFAMLQWWLVKAHDVNLSRRVTPYIDLYPEAYLKYLAQGTQTDLETITAAYLEHNATRNRALDLLPLLAHIDEDRVRKVIDDDRIKPRPAFHYRLPNCAIDSPDWTLAQSWNVWCVVEDLADNRELLTALCSDFVKAGRPLLGVDKSRWIEKIEKCLQNAASE